MNIIPVTNPDKLRCPFMTAISELGSPVICITSNCMAWVEHFQHGSWEKPSGRGYCALIEGPAPIDKMAGLKSKIEKESHEKP